MTALAIHPLTPDRWDDFVALFETDSICKMCWCVHHRMPAAVRREATSKSRKTAMAKIVKNGPPPGLLAYKGDEAVGWLAIAPRPATPDWNEGRKASAAELPEHGEDETVWGASCFFIRKDARGTGLSATLLDAGTAYAKKLGAKTVEACPMAHDEKRSTTGMFVGPKRVFDRAGFETVLERKPGRPLMRLSLASSIKKKPAAVTKAAKTKARAPKGLKT
ncbi:MAG TPA: GNAT family N-acetyltransferase [Hyphomonadaceae bacterium]|nr:GNAT family N-acetyltransferase [Hyphomonadaceae bacterium]HPI47130.1 GNAT family N-acetyltransferase [Hyphomonadaceae bacterium]